MDRRGELGLVLTMQRTPLDFQSKDHLTFLLALLIKLGQQPFSLEQLLSPYQERGILQLS